MLTDLPKQAAGSTVNEPCERTVKPLLEGNSTQISRTPNTPVTSEGLLSLQNLINQDAHSLDEVSKRRLRKHLQKLANAATTSFAERALQEEQIRFLYKVNNEAKVRRTTKSVVLGKAKVMSYDELEEARAKRAAKEHAAAAGNGKRGRKRKTQVSVANEPMVEQPPVDVLEFRAPVARMR